LDVSLSTESFDNYTYERCLEEGLVDAVCVTCRILRPPRSKHCRDCNKCVTRFDHHCPWIDNCVGEKNHRSFLGFSFIIVFTLFLFFALEVRYASLPSSHTPLKMILVIPLLMNAITVGIYVSLLLFQQIGLVMEGLTTNEKINSWRYGYLKDPSGSFKNPFDKGGCLNFLLFLPFVKPIPLNVINISQLHSFRRLPSDIQTAVDEHGAHIGHGAHGGHGGHDHGAHGHGAHGHGGHGGHHHGHGHDHSGHDHSGGGDTIGDFFPMGNLGQFQFPGITSNYENLIPMQGYSNGTLGGDETAVDQKHTRVTSEDQLGLLGSSS